MNENKNPFQEDVEDLIEKELNRDLTEDEKLIASLRSNTVIPLAAPEVAFEKDDMKPVVVQSCYNPATGVNTPIETKEIDDVQAEIDRIADDFDFDPDALLEKMMNDQEITSEKLFNYVSKNHPTLPDEDIKAIVVTAMDHINKIPVNYYRKLPESIQSQINQSIAGVDQNNIKSLRNATARSFVEDIVNSCTIENGGVDINDCITEIRNVGKELNDEISGIETGMRISMITKIIDAYDKKKEEDPDAEPNAIVEALRQSVILTDFMEFCKTVRIKKFELEKLKPFEDFNRKYYTHTLNIHDIRSCPTILSKHIQTHVDDDGAYKVCLAFCKYCLNYSPDVPEQHMFMYYFVENIYLMDLICPGGVIVKDNNRSNEMMEFYHTHVTALKNCIENMK